MGSSTVVRASGVLPSLGLTVSTASLGKLNEIAIWKLIVRCPLERRDVVVVVIWSRDRVYVIPGIIPKSEPLVKVKVPILGHQ